jgi:DNA-binding NtrC family response regulator
MKGGVTEMTRKPVILIVEDTDDIEKYCLHYLSERYQFIKAFDGPQALSILGKERIDLVFLDQNFRDTPGDRLLGSPPEHKTEGLAIMKAIRAAGFGMPVIMITQYASVDLVEKALAADISAILETEMVLENEAYLTEKVDELLSPMGKKKDDIDKDLIEKYGPLLIGRSPAIIELLRRIEKIKDTEVPVLITGETGVGKSLIARAIHQVSLRRTRAFVTVECPSIPEALFENQLFGHRKGAFTGAHDAMQGLILRADQGTLFLDEISTIPAATQAKLLRTIEEKVFIPLGDSLEQKVSFRVLSATNEDLNMLVRRNRFRQDLLSRLNGFRLAVPPLRDRREDIPLLIEHFTSELSVPVTEALTRELTQNYDWRQGNIRELRNTLAQIWALDQDGVLGVDDLARFLKEKRSISQESTERVDGDTCMCFLEENAWKCPILKERKLEKIVRAAERIALLETCKDTKDWQDCAQSLGISKSQFYTKKKEHGIP